MTSAFRTPGKQLFLLVLAGLLCAQPPEKFEVASVKLIPPDRTGCTSTDQSRCLKVSEWGGATFIARNISMLWLVEIAYHVDDVQITGTDRLGNELYDITAKPENGGVLTFARAQPMLRALLEERFKLVAHRETNDVAGYALTIAKGGPKLNSYRLKAGRIDDD